MSYERCHKAKPPKIGYHITYLENLASILIQGLLTHEAVASLQGKAVWLFTDKKLAHVISKDLELKRTKDWVLLQVSDLKMEYLLPDEDYGDTWEESIRYSGRFAYSKSIPTNNIEIVSKEIGTKYRYHNEFIELT